MCDDRERLIGYLYGDCDPAERRAVEQHLEVCPECREEIGGLRQVRHDLLAWRVPDPEPIWRPVLPRPERSWWEQVPAWAMAAAAALLLVAGAAGGMATRLLLVPPTPVMENAATRPESRSLDQDEVAALEARLLATLRAEMDDRVRVVASEVHEPVPSRDARPDPAVAQLSREVAELRALQTWLAESVMEDVQRISERQRTTDERSFLMYTSLSQGGGR